MDKMNVDMIWTLIFLPVLAGLFKTEIANTWSAWCAYRARPFDLDRDPTTPDLCMLLNTATGQWGLVVIHKYVFWKIQTAARGVFFSHVTGDGLFSRQVGLIEWSKMAKSKVPQHLDMETRVVLQRHNLLHLAPSGEDKDGQDVRA